MNRADKLLMLRWSVLAAVLGICMMIIWMGTGRVKADPTPTMTPVPNEDDWDYVNKDEYVDGVFDGTVTVNTVNVRSGPGTTYELVKTSGGKTVKITNGNGKKVTIIGESKDKELEAWYHVRFEFQDSSMDAPEVVEGYCFAEFIRKDVKVTFTPTPTPAEDEKPTATPTIAGAENVMNNEGEASENNKKMEEDSKGLGPWKYVLILAIVLVILTIVYTLYNRIQEQRLENEMERYSSSHTIEKLEGEDEEDFRQAKKKFYSRMKLGDQSNRDLGEEIGNPDDIQLDLAGIFENEDDGVEDIARTVQNEQEEQGITEEDYSVDVDDSMFEDEEAFDDVETTIEDVVENPDMEEISEAVEEEIQAAQEETWVPEEKAPNVVEEAPVVESAPEEDVRIYQMPVSPAPVAATEKQVSAVDAQIEARRAHLDRLKEQEWIQHKLYGEGEVIDNSDAEIIQVRFGRDLRFLKKEKLARKDLVIF